jgi:hypothetical protein
MNRFAERYLTEDDDQPAIIRERGGNSFIKSNDNRSIFSYKLVLIFRLKILYYLIGYLHLCKVESYCIVQLESRTFAAC